jgi:hypothetical protein
MKLRVGGSGVELQTVCASCESEDPLKRKTPVFGPNPYDFLA